MVRMTKLPDGFAICPHCDNRVMAAGDLGCRVCLFKMPAHQKEALEAQVSPEHRFVVLGAPRPKGRPRTVTRDGKTRTFTPRETKDYEALVQHHAALARLPKPIEGPVEMELLFVTHLTKKGKCKADIDNMAKAIMDAVNGICYLDDRQVRKLTCEVVPVQRGERTEIIVREYKENQ